MLYAMFALVVLTFLMMALTGYVRMRSVSTGQVPARYYKLMQGAELPETVIKVGRHLNNLFEMPVLFYSAGILTIVLHQETFTMLALAWAFVVCRLLHAFIHITYNHPLHRLVAFTLGCCALLGMWIELLINA
jgi:hypothetical protein